MGSPPASGPARLQCGMPYSQPRTVDRQMGSPPTSGLTHSSSNSPLPALKDSNREAGSTEKTKGKSQQQEDREARKAFEQSEPIQVIRRECSSHFLHMSKHNSLGDAQVSPPHGIDPVVITASTIADIIQKVQTPADVDALMPSLTEALKKEKKMTKGMLKTTYLTMYAFEHPDDEEGPHKHTLNFATRMAALAKFRFMFATVSLPAVLLWRANR